MKKIGNIEHRIQLKKDEIARYQVACKNYPPDRMQKYGFPYLKKLESELTELQREQK